MRTAFIKLEGQRNRVNVNKDGYVVHRDQTVIKPEWLPITTGAVYGVALNYKGLLADHLVEFHEPPYKTPPVKPVLFIKPSNTYNAHQAPIIFPKGVPRIQAGPALGFVMAKDASRIKKQQAMDYVAGFTIVNEVSLPEDSYYRPAVKAKCQDSFCPMGPWIVDKSEINPCNLTISVYVNGEIRQQNNTNNMICSIPQLIKEITEFMTLKAGDVIITGVPEDRTDIKVGDVVEVVIEDIGTLTNPVIAE